MPNRTSAIICCFLIDLDSVIDENFQDWVSSQFFSLKTYVRCFGVGWKASLPHDPLRASDLLNPFALGLSAPTLYTLLPEPSSPQKLSFKTIVQKPDTGFDRDLIDQYRQVVAEFCRSPKLGPNLNCRFVWGQEVCQEVTRPLELLYSET